MQSGVYCIKIGGRVRYVGGTKDFETRWSIHKRQLVRGCHCNPNLQKEYNENPDLEFEILEKCKNYFERESFWADKFGINSLTNAKRPDRYGGEEKEEVKKKKSRSLKNYYQTHSGNKAMLGKHHSEETKRKIALHHNPKSNPPKGRCFSPETRQKISEGLRKAHQQKPNWRSKKEN